MSDLTKTMERIAALIAKAESTTHPEEAQAFIAGAQRIATANAIDLAVARQHAQRADRRELLAQRRLDIGPPRSHANARLVALLITVTWHNDVRCTITRGNTSVTMYGFGSDMDVVQALYSSLAVQMVTAAHEAIRRGEHRKEENHYFSERAWEYRSDARTFKANFYDGFIAAIGQRLADARQDAVAAAQRSADADAGAGAAADGAAPEDQRGSIALVLRSKAEAVQRYFEDETTHVRGTWKPTTTAADLRGARAAGQRAGRSAALSGRDALGGRSALRAAE
jgi:hypothetical protein